MFSAMPLGLAIHNKWDSISMATPPLHSLRMERPAYSTPAPVENTPSNNECRMVELRGAKIASFIVAGEEFICLPQAFDLFLKHLVGGLHTVYTKLKRLSISPVVCNVEQVRILRGIGAIQPGVNRCKLITRKDFETLYQDCTTATRPGRPPKRYPMLPPTTDYMSPHSSLRGGSGSHGLLNSSDFSSLHKRMRLDAGDKPLHTFQDRRRASCSPPNGEGLVTDKDVSMANVSDLHSNPTANLYLQAQQALRQQYQQATSQQLEAHHAAAAAGLNHLNMMMMSHPNFFSGGIPPSSINMLNHVNQLAQNHNAANMSAAAAVAQIAASGGNIHQAAAAQAAAQVAASFAAAQEANRDANSEHANEEKDSDHETKQDTQQNQSGQNLVTNGIGSDGRASPESSLSEGCGSHLSENSDNALSASDSGDSIKDAGVNGESHQQTDGQTILPNENDTTNFDGSKTEEEDQLSQHNSSLGAAALSLSSMGVGNGGQSSMQTLLTNIQGLLKVAADNARLQEKHKSFEIADLKIRLGKERQLREDLEKKVQQMTKSKDELVKRLKKERKSRKYYQEQLSAIRPFSQRDGAENSLSANSPPPTSDAESNRSNSHGPLTPPVSGKSYLSPQCHSPSAETTENKFSKESVSAEYENAAEVTTPKSSSAVHSTSLVIGENVNNNNRAITTNRHPPSSTNDHSSSSPQECSLSHHERRSGEHVPLADSKMFFKAPILFQTTASQ